MIPSIDFLEISARCLVTLAHFVWQALVIAAVLLIALQLSSRASASLRYLFCCLGLVAMPTVAIVTFLLLPPVGGTEATVEVIPNPVAVASETIEPALEPVPVISMPTPTPGPLVADQASPVPSQSDWPEPTSASDHRRERATPLWWSQQLRTWSPWLVAVYAAGVFVMLGRLGLSLGASQRVRASVTRVTESVPLKVLGRQAKRLGLRQVPVLARCPRIPVPVVIGIVRPMILFPSSLLSGIDPESLSAILSHELAHIRRGDLWVNLLQRLIEALFFFHPAAWWISRRVSAERENCCDDVAAADCGSLRYVAALLEMAEQCAASRGLNRSRELAALSAAGESTPQLSLRVQRLLGVRPIPGYHLSRRLVIFAAVLIGLGIGALVTLAQSEVPPSHETTANASQTDDEPHNSISKRGDDKPAANSENAPSDDLVPDDEGIYWGTRQLNGWSAGVKVLQYPRDDDRRLLIKHFVRNNLNEPQTAELRFRGSAPVHFRLDDKRRLEVRFRGSSLDDTIVGGPGEVITSEKWQSEIDLSKLTGGDYALKLDSVFTIPHKTQRGSRLGIPWAMVLPLDLPGSPDETDTNQETKTQDTTAEIRWGKPVEGLRLGVAFVDPPLVEPPGFHPLDTASVQLFIQNVSDQAIDCSVLLPHFNDGWGLNIDSSMGAILINNHLRISTFSPLRLLHANLDAGEVQTITGELDKFASREDLGPLNSIEHAEFKIAQHADSDPAYQPPFTYVLHYGDYQVGAFVTVRKTSLANLDLSLQSGKLDFQVVRRKAGDAPTQPAPDQPGYENTRWQATGTVTDKDGNPVADAEVWVHTGIGSLKRAGSARTNDQGKYTVRFGPGILMHEDLSGLQYANVTVHKPGFAEQNLNRHGAGVLANRDVTDDELEIFGAERNSLVLPGRGRQVDFVLVPAVRIEGRLTGTGTFPGRSPQELKQDREPPVGNVQLSDSPLSGWQVWLTGEELPPASNILASAKTDASGNFVFENVPLGFDWYFKTETNLPQHPTPVSRRIRFEADEGGKTRFVTLNLTEQQDEVRVRFETLDEAAAAAQPRAPDGTRSVLFQLVDGETGVPLEGLDVDIALFNTVKAEKATIRSSKSEMAGRLRVTLADNEIANVVGVPEGWIMGPPQVTVQSVDEDPEEVANEDESSKPSDDARIVKLWRGTPLKGRLVWPDGTPAAFAPLSVGVYIDHMGWKEKLGMDLTFYSFDHGDWPNWQLQVTTDKDGVFRTTVPPEDARRWVRVGTTTLGFTSVPASDVTQQAGQRLAECIPLEVEFKSNDVINPVVDGEFAGSDDALNLGDLRLRRGVIVRGRVVDVEGNGLSNISLTTAGPHGPHSGRSCFTEADGRFEFQAIAPGSLTINVDARLRDANRQVISYETQGVFSTQTIVVPDQELPFEQEIRALPHRRVEFNWIDRRSKPDQPIAYYGSFRVRGFLPDKSGESSIYWTGETQTVNDEGTTKLVILIPTDLKEPTLILNPNRLSTPSYQDSTGRKSGPGLVELLDLDQSITRTVFGDDPKQPENRP